MDVRTLVLPLSKQEFRSAKQGYVIKKNFVSRGEEICVLITNRVIREEESREFLKRGISVAPLDVSEFEWYDIDKIHRNFNAIEYEDLEIVMVSNSVFNKIQRERGGMDDGFDTGTTGRLMERPA